MKQKNLSIRLAVLDGKKVEQTFNRIGERGDRAMHKISNATKPASAGLKAVDTSAKALNRTLRQGAALVAGYVSVTGALRGVQSIASTAFAFEGITNAMEAATGSARLSGEEMNFVENESERLGLQLQETSKAYAQLLAAARGTSIEGAQTRQVFTAVAEAATVLRLSIDDTRGALRAVNQIISKGKVQAEELRGQLGERVPGAFQAAARAMNLTTEELDDQLELGNVYADEFLPKFAAEIRKTYAIGVPKAASSAAAELNRFNNSILDIERKISANGFLTGVTEGLRSLTDTLRDPEVQEAAAALGRALGATIEAAADALGFLVRNADIAITAIGGLVIARTVAAGVAVLAGGVGVLNTIFIASKGFTAAFAAQLLVMEGAARLATVASLGLRRALLLLGGPVGIAVLAGIALYKLTQGHDAASEAATKHSNELQGARSELDDFLNSTNQLNEALRPDLEDRLKDQIRAARASISAVKGELAFDPLDGFFDLDRFFRSSELTSKVEGLRRQFANGKITAKQYAAAMIDLGKQFPSFADEAEETKSKVIALIAAQRALATSMGNLDKLREERELRAKNKNKPDTKPEIQISAKEQERITKRLADLAAEEHALRRVAAARKEGEAALRQALVLNEQERALRQLGLTLNEKEGSDRAKRANQVKELVARIEALKNAEKAYLKEQREAQKLERKREKLVADVKKRYDELDTTLAGAIERAKAWRTEAMAGLNATAEGYVEFRNQVDAVFNDMLKEAWDEDLRNSKRWQDGVTRALKDVIEEANDKASQMEGLFTNAFKGMEDAMVNFVKTGKLDFASLADSIISDLIRMQVQASITGPLATALNAGIGSLFGAPGGGGTAAATTPTAVAHTGGVIGSDRLATRAVNPAVFNAAPRFHGGGVVGSEVPIIAQRGEAVLTPGQMAMLGSAVGQNKQPNVTVNIHNNSGTQTEAHAAISRQPNGDLSLDVILEKMQGDMARNISRGEGLAPTLERRYGLNPAAGSYR